MDGLHDFIRPLGVVGGIFEYHKQGLGCIDPWKVDAAVHGGFFVLLGNVGDLDQAKQLLVLPVFVTPHGDGGSLHFEIMGAVGLGGLSGRRKVLFPARQ